MRETPKQRRQRRKRERAQEAEAPPVTDWDAVQRELHKVARRHPRINLLAWGMFDGEYAAAGNIDNNPVLGTLSAMGSMTTLLHEELKYISPEQGKTIMATVGEVVGDDLPDHHEGIT